MARVFGLNSFRGRFLYVVALSACVLLGTTWYSSKQAANVTQKALADSSLQQEYGRVVLEISTGIWELEDELFHAFEFSTRRSAIILRKTINKLRPLTDNAKWQRVPEVPKAAKTFVNDLDKLYVEITDPTRFSLTPDARRERIKPLLDNSRASLIKLESLLENRVLGDIQALTVVIERQLHPLWVATVVGIVAILCGFLLFEFSIRRPVVRIADALKREAEGGRQMTIPHTWTQETENLVTAFDYMRQQVRARQQRLETILDNAAEGIIIFDSDGRIESFNKAAERLFGYAENEVVGKDLRLILPPRTRDNREDYLKHFMRNEIQRLIGHEGEVLGRHKDGITFPMALKISTMTLGTKQLYTGLVADISERKAMLENLKNMAEHDGLTGLYNRTYFQQELERVVERVRRSGGLCCSLLYIDLDNFKYVNDTLGHAAGDRLIVEVAGILNKRARKSDLIARIGGDEFSVLLFDTTPALSVQVAESFRSRLADYAFKHSGDQVDIGCSIGVTAISPDTGSATEVLSQADLACHLAKRGGRNRVHMYDVEDAKNVAAMTLDMGWSRRIKEAIEKDRFLLAYQPIVATATREIECYEVLLRLLDERDELIMPSGFLPTAERFGLSAEVDQWVIHHALDELARQRVQNPKLRYAINLSARTLTTPGICDLIQAKINDVGLHPGALTFEVTETVAIADMAAAEQFLTRLRNMGCRTALDDFGSGMASFAYLKDLPVSSVKIDGRFVKNLAVNPVDQAMVRAMNEIAHALGKQTIAEFVENEESFKLLAAYGVDYAQGYYVGRPEQNLSASALLVRKRAT